MKRKPDSAYAVIDYGRTISVCMDIHCPCGEHVHLDTYEGDCSAEYVRCPWCKDVLRIGADVNLLDQKEDFSLSPDVFTFIQWKGTDVFMQAHCTCGQTFDVERDFAYEVDCPHCKRHYHCESTLEVTRLTTDEAAGVAQVNEPDKEVEDMDDEELAAYEKKIGVSLPATTSTVPAPELDVMSDKHHCCGECDEADARLALESGHLINPHHIVFGCRPPSSESGTALEVYILFRRG